MVTLSDHRRTLAPLLAGPRPSAPLDPASGGIAGALQECLLLLVSPDPYTAVLGKPQATALAAAVLTALADAGACGRLAGLLAAALLPPASPGPGQAQAPGAWPVAAKPYVEALATQLVVRLLALKGWAPAGPEASLHSLLFVPSLWQRCASLQPVAPRVARTALAWLAAAGPARLRLLLPGAGGAGTDGEWEGLPGGPGTAVAVLLSNVLAVGPRLLQPDRSAGAAVPASTASLRPAALATCRVLQAAVQLLPLAPFFPEPLGGGGAEEESDDVDEAACGSLGLARLALGPGAVPRLPPGLVEGVQGLTGATGRQLLKQLVCVLLPLASSAGPGSGGAGPREVVMGSSPPLSSAPSLAAGLPSSTAPGLASAAASAAQSTTPPSTAHLLEAAEAAHAVSELVWQLSQLPGQRQRVLLGLAVGADFVERMWWSFLRPARLADLAAITWLPDEPGPGTISPGGTRASVSTSSSFTCTGAVPMEVELSSGAAGPGPGSGFGSAPMSRAQSIDAGGEGPGGPGGGGCWRPRTAEELGWLLPLAVTCAAFTAHVTTATLDEFYGSGAGGGGGGGGGDGAGGEALNPAAQKPLALQQLYDGAVPEAGFLAMLRDSLWHVLWSDWETEHSAAGEALYGVTARAGGQLYGILYERNCRRAFCPTAAFHATALAPERFLTEASTHRSAAGREDGTARVWQVLRHAPPLVPFAERARLFQLMVGKEREEYRAQEDSRFLEAGMLEAGLGNRFVPIRRDQLLFDGFDRLNAMGERLRGRVRIMFIDAHGVPEAGVDGGGLFKDFMEELMHEGLSAAYGLFAANPSHQLYPNPAAMRAVEDAPRLLAFLGRMLGKALWENVLLELPLAGFFLKKFRGAHCDLNDLPTLDPDLYRSLLRLREHLTATASAAAAAAGAAGAGGAGPDGSAAGGGEAAAAMDLGITFVVADDAAAALGDPHAEVELKPGGRLIPVTADNVREYMHRVAHYKLNIAPRPAVSAFLSGFFELIPRAWVSMFSGEELQTLVSGADTGGLDLEDLAAHVEYAGGYHEDHPVIHTLWEALASFTPEQQGAFLKFVTSCSRPPLLGFKYLEPRLCIQMSGAMLDPAAPQRLPTASTCMNLLKLPPYRTLAAMREKLLYAVTSGAGFDLS
ncbi:hypothetical protein HYH03_009301 [Edaphochlamys debaryana]|uniref:HECT-type E3 ubiquitin transferase n=1 Tax=Edaphochlamys debaryana TaxID=47281 RepID=A0A835Y0F4_9CHLO|nr:hypothetical protein HYH03_009301 [Edaphochlamys debaryana]|eukprot:KAG2492353.1 hypothetical protein HYH03_009301 [Edaphochlamys debaryana]